MEEEIMKRLITMLITLAVLLTSFVIPFASFAEEAAENLTVDLGGGGEARAIDLAVFEESSAAFQLSITAPALRIEICCPTWSRPAGGFLTMSLFKFDKNYETSVAGNTIASKRHEEFDDNAWIGLDFSPDKPLEPGEYIVLLDEVEVGQQTGLWFLSPSENQIFYSDGKIDESGSIRSRITFLGKPDTYYGKLTKPQEEEIPDPVDSSDEPYMDYTMIFNDPDWEDIFQNPGSLTYEFDDDYLTFSIPFGSDDPQVQLLFNNITDEEGILVEKYPIMLMKVRRLNDTDPVTGEVFFFTETSPGPKAGNSFLFNYENTLDWQYVLIDLSSNKRCRDYLTGIRFDVFDHAPEGGELDVAWITFFETKSAAQKFNGDFSPYVKATEVPTAKPTAAPTEVPKPTDAAPTQAPATATGGSAPSEPTADKGDDKTDPGKNNDKKNNNTPLIIISAIVGVVIIAAVIGIVVMRSKGKKGKDGKK